MFNLRGYYCYAPDLSSQCELYHDVPLLCRCEVRLNYENGRLGEVRLNSKYSSLPCRTIPAQDSIDSGHNTYFIQDPHTRRTLLPVRQGGLHSW